MKLFLCGDVMTGRGVDQVLPHSCSPELYEHYLSSAADYVALAEAQNGPIPRPVDEAYVWGDALEVLSDEAPDARIINLETAITCDGRPFPKGINYRMHPGNTAVLSAAGVHCSVLANNHVLDWGTTGLTDTLDALSSARIEWTGAGRNRGEAENPAVIPVGAEHRVLVFAYGAQDSGVPPTWSATETSPGVAVLPDYTVKTVERITQCVHGLRRQGDVVVLSLHWGPNWGYEIPPDHRRFAHMLIDRDTVDIVYGHSSHHPRAIEVYRQRLILYGCGDLLNDYEGIPGYEAFRNDLALLYLPIVEGSSGMLHGLEMVPLQIRKFRLRHTSANDRGWLCRTLDRECRRYGCRVVDVNGRLLLDA